MATARRARERGLEGVRVLEFPDPKTALCGKLLADMGADVVMVERATGPPLRTAPPLAKPTGEGLFFWYTCANKRSVGLDVASPKDRETFLGLVKNADVLIDPFAPGYLASLGLDDETIRTANPRLIFISVTNFGQAGPFRDLASSDLVAMATSGMLSLSGDPAREPLNPPAYQGYQITSLWATIAIQGAIFRRLRTGQGARLDISMQEALFDISEMAHSVYLATGEIVQRLKGDHPMALPFKLYRTMDGYAFICTVGATGWETLMAWMKEAGVDAEVIQRINQIPAAERLKHRQEINAAVGMLASRLRNKDILNEGVKRRLAIAPARKVRENLDDDQLQHRRFFGRVGEYPYLNLPFQGKPGPQPGRADPPPAIGQHTDEVLREWSRPGRAWPATSERDRSVTVAARTVVADRPDSETRRSLPLDGIKVLEFTGGIAGPTIARVLADLGAIVYKVEQKTDAGRGLVPSPVRAPRGSGSYSFHDINRNKLSITIDMKQPRAPDLAVRMARQVDVVVENFTAGTFDKLKIPYKALSAENPRLILGSLTGFGQTGTRAGWPSVHPTSAALSGLVDLFSYEDGEPMGFGNSYMDYAAGFTGTIGVLDGLLRREVTGAGDHVDISQLESAVLMVGAQLAEWTVNGDEARGHGNGDWALGAPFQGVFPCRGDDRWIGVTAQDGRALEALRKLIGVETPSPSQGEGWDGGKSESPTKGSGALARLDQALRQWTAQREPWAAFEELQRHGVAAGVVSNGRDLAERDEHLHVRRAVAWMLHPELGRVPIVQCPILLDGERLPVHTRAPFNGEHTQQILQRFGFSDAEYRQFAAEQVV